MTEYALIVPMSGTGQRFLAKGYTNLKPFIEVNGETIISRLLNRFPNASEVFFILSDEIRSKFDYLEELRRIRPDAKLIFISPHKKGPSFAVWSAREQLSTKLPIIVSYCDFSGLWSDEYLVETLMKYDGIVATYKGFHPHMLENTKYAYIRKEVDLVFDIREKNSFTENPMDEEASCGIYGFKNMRYLLESIEYQIKNEMHLSGEFYTSLTIKAMLSLNYRVTSYVIEKFYQWGTPEDLNSYLYWSNLFFNLRLRRNDFTKVPNHSSILLSAGESKRIVSAYNISKPFLPILNRKLLDFSLDLISITEHGYIFIRKDSESEYVENLVANIELLSTVKPTRGQAESALLALNQLKKTNDPITFLAVDNILPINSISEVDKIIKHESVDLLVWNYPFYPPSISNPNDFSWVEYDQMRKVCELHFKARPNLEQHRMGIVMGNFTFRSRDLAQSVCEEVLMKNPEANGEYYLDRVIDVCLSKGLRVFSYQPSYYVALGTKDELESFKYWEACDFT